MALYRRVLAALDGSEFSDFVSKVALDLATKGDGSSSIIGCHVYSARMHRARFGQMEPGLPTPFQEGARLEGLRKAHTGLISEGMRLISKSYLEPLERAAQDQGIHYESETPEGRNYVQLLKLAREKEADLLILGAEGQGHAPEEKLGSLAERLLLLLHSGDILVMRRPLDFNGHPIVVGVDGSKNSYAALAKAAEIGAAFGASVEAVAVYDPHLHTGIFRTLSGTLPQDGFDLDSQKKLHDEIIDSGLEQLYRAGLEEGAKNARATGADVRVDVVAGKVHPQLHHYAALKNAGMVVVGRWGLHQEDESPIGSNALNLARQSTGNVLVVTPGSDSL